MKTNAFFRNLLRGGWLAAIALCLTALPACDTDDPADGDDETENGQGTGTGEEPSTGSDDPVTAYYEALTDNDATYDEATNTMTIRTERGLRAWAWNGGNYPPTRNAVLAADITLTERPEDPEGESNWMPIPLKEGMTFDGAGHTVSGVKVSSELEEIGFFSYVSPEAAVKNLRVEGDYACTGTQRRLYMGGIAGQCKGSIDGCSFSGTLDGGKSTETGGVIYFDDRRMVGGITGRCEEGWIANCSASGTFTVESNYPPSEFDMIGGNWAGGIAGQMDGDMTGCTVAAGTRVEGYFAGGLAAYAATGNADHCTAAASVSEARWGGGLMGYAGDDLFVCRDCHTTAGSHVSAYKAGGLTGFSGEKACLFGCTSAATVEGTITGFLTGEEDEGVFIACIATGDMKAEDNTYGLHGTIYQAVNQIYSCYATGTATEKGVRDESVSGGYVRLPGGTTMHATDAGFTWADATQKLNAGITEVNTNDQYNDEWHNKLCLFHFVQTDGTSEPPTLAAGQP